MTDKPKRRIRVRRKRRQDGGDSLFDGDDVGEAVTTFGCCLFEVVASAATVIALIVVPFMLLS